MRVVLITVYDHYALGARSLAAAVSQAGHEVWLINFKRLQPRAVARDDAAEWARLAAGGHQPCVEIHPSCNVVCPYPFEPTPAERDLLRARVRAIAPDVIGFSLTSSHLPLAVELTADMRRTAPGTPIVWGGIHPTMDPAGSLAHADAVCVGEGDEAFVEYLADPRRTDVANFWYRGGDGGPPVANAPRPLIQNLDALPWALYGDNEVLIDDGGERRFADYTLDEVKTLLTISSHRGCPFGCTYCLHSRVRELYPSQKYLRRKSPRRFIEEVAHRVASFGLPDVVFWDDIFMIGPAWMDEFLPLYRSRVGLPFGGYGHPRTTPRAMLDGLARAGCQFVAMGIQTGSAYVNHEIYGRHEAADEYVRLGRDALDAGIPNLVCDILSNCAFEREEDCRATVELLARMPRMAKIAVKKLEVFPHSRISTMDRPRGGVDDATFHFFNMLYLLAGQRGFEPRALPALAGDPRLRAEPALVEGWVRELDAMNGRLGELEALMPWGIKRAARHLAAQVADRAKRTLGHP